jgi:hypothetical protein
MDGTRTSPLRKLRTSGQIQPATPDRIALKPRTIDRVAVYFSRLGAPMYTHEKVTLSIVAENIACVNGWRYEDVYDPAERCTGGLFFVPDDTLMLDEAQGLGIYSPHQLYGAVAPYPFVKTKAITHRLVSSHAARPHGWSWIFADSVRNAVLPGYTVFSSNDARMAAMRLLPLGSVRIKKPLGDGGYGQTAVAGIVELDAFLEKLSLEEIECHGLVLETNLRNAITRSVGQTMIGDQMITYYGTQRSVTNNHGLTVYGGSDLICVRGGWTELEKQPMDADARLAVSQARTYDRSADRFPSFLASRRNYDIGQGIDGRGRWRSGVFEASWRSGGASTAELAALMAFAQDSTLQVIETTSAKQFGRRTTIPAGAVVHFHGDDPDDGPLLRYTVVTRAMRRAA